MLATELMRKIKASSRVHSKPRWACAPSSAQEPRGFTFQSSRASAGGHGALRAMPGSGGAQGRTPTQWAMPHGCWQVAGSSGPESWCLALSSGIRISALPPPAGAPQLWHLPQGRSRSPAPVDKGFQMHIHAWARLTNYLEVTGSRQMNPGLGLGHASTLHGLGPVVTAPHSYAAATAWRPAGLGAPGEGGAAWSQGSGTMRPGQGSGSQGPQAEQEAQGWPAGTCCAVSCGTGHGCPNSFRVQQTRVFLSSGNIVDLG